MHFNQRMVNYSFFSQIARIPWKSSVYLIGCTQKELLFGIARANKKLLDYILYLASIKQNRLSHPRSQNILSCYLCEKD